MGFANEREQLCGPACRGKLLGWCHRDCRLRAHLAVDFAVYEEEWNGGGFRRISDFITDAVKPYGAVLLLYSGRAHYDAMQFLGGAAIPSIGYGGGHGHNVHGYGGAVAGCGDFSGHAEYRGFQPPRDDEDEWACSMM